ncbi:hypothetical protein AVEN_110293-1 [Araneus ventricosus]|uniref:Uncharacterized protein n=1 Tax=Araneus ventricosus TaxID=182803 RepID=A0A4Y2DPC6_ARAVE|nr:hypothetical protein AVEN_110293-1 [Araneus ventricosus]
MNDESASDQWMTGSADQKEVKVIELLLIHCCPVHTDTRKYGDEADPDGCTEYVNLGQRIALTYHKARIYTVLRPRPKHLVLRPLPSYTHRNYRAEQSKYADSLFNVCPLIFAPLAMAYAVHMGNLLLFILEN